MLDDAHVPDPFDRSGRSPRRALRATQRTPPLADADEAWRQMRRTVGSRRPTAPMPSGDRVRVAADDRAPFHVADRLPAARNRFDVDLRSPGVEGSGLPPQQTVNTDSVARCDTANGAPRPAQASGCRVIVVGAQVNRIGFALNVRRTDTIDATGALRQVHRGVCNARNRS